MKTLFKLNDKILYQAIKMYQKNTNKIVIIQKIVK